MARRKRKSSKRKKSKRSKLNGVKGKKRFGKSNGRWKGGGSKSYRRRVTKAKKGEIVHHKDKNKKNNKLSNFQKMSRSKHNKMHPEKGGHNKKRGRRGRRK